MTSKRALIIKMGAIGDVITTVPAARALYEQGYEIHWVCGKAVLQLLASYSWINPIPVDDAAILKGSLVKRIASIVRLWRKVALRRWKLVAILYFDWRYRLLLLPVRADRKVALDNRRRQTSLITVRSYSDEFARIMLGLEDECRPTGLGPLRPDKVPPSPLPPKQLVKRAAIVPGGTSNLISQQTLRRWPIANYVALTAKLLERNWEVVLIGGSGDEWVRSHFQNMNVTDCIARFSLLEVIGLFDACDVVVSHDTGPMHLAGLSHSPLVAIFGPSNPGHVLPRRPDVIGMWGGKEYACRPCYDLRTYADCKSAGCMQEVTVSDVIRQIDRLLLSNPGEGTLSPWQIIFPRIDAHDDR